MNQLPAYLLNRKSTVLTERATQGMGGLLPPHISIGGNQFTLIDRAGNDTPAGQVLQVCVVDISDVMAKRYYENDWVKGADDPPTCWSSNGIGPSRDATVPQSPTGLCADCEWNKRGSDTSRISGKPIKACRDEKLLAVMIPSYRLDMLFQLVLTPGSFKNWIAFMAPFKQGNIDVSDVVIQVEFEAQVNGVLEFKPISYINEQTFAAREKALLEKATDEYVGRNDVPIGGRIAGPAQQQQITHQTQQQQPTQVPQNQFASQEQGGLVGQGGPFVGQAGTTSVGAGASTQQQPGPQFNQGQGAQNVSPPSETQRRRPGRPRNNPAPAQQQTTGQQSAPFPVDGQQTNMFSGGAPETTGGPTHGIGGAVAPDPQLAAMLASLSQSGT
jgi:hypothetical protein